MCTVTFIARRNGYALGMNRDEKLSRPSALPPVRVIVGKREAIFPSEPGGGTWIGVNDAGVTFALINWYSVLPLPCASDSRGDVVRSLLAADSPATSREIVGVMPLSRVNPFRLIGVFPVPRLILEWRWNLKVLESINHAWRTNTWISSGFNEADAQQARGKTFTEALRQPAAGTIPWLRRLHRSHLPEPGPYSTCMHREGAATLSYTEIMVSQKSATMHYHEGQPCRSPLTFLQSQSNAKDLKYIYK